MFSHAVSRGIDRFNTKVIGSLVVFVLALTMLSQTHAASQIDAPFDSANILYEQGHYKEAAESYRQLIANDSDSAAIHFNLGNALYQLGQIGAALGEYQLALAFAPRDPDILANIRFTKEKLGASAVIPRSFWQQLLLQLTLNEWTLLALAPYWAWICVSAMSLFLKEGRTGLSTLAKYAAIAFLVTGLLLFSAANERLGKQYAVVTAKEAVVRFGPFEESKSSHNLVDGIEIQLIDYKDGWHQIRDPQDQIGWLRQDQVLKLQAHP